MTLDSYIAGLKGRRIAVLGLGVSNMPLLEKLLAAGCDVTARDKRDEETFGAEAAERLRAAGCDLRLGPDYLEELDADVIFRTPGMHPFTPQLAEAKGRGAVLTSEMEAFFAVCPCPVIAVTGSDGKTTTTTIISELLRAEGYTVHLGGNIGTPLLTKADDMKPEDVVVLELSSFQLHSMYCRPHVAVITNVSPNHLDIHPSYEDYQAAKKQIFLNQGEDDVLVVNADNDITRAMADEAKGERRFFSRRERVENGCFFADDAVWRAENGAVTRLLGVEDILLPGMHNVENYMAAFAATRGLVSDETCRKVAGSFRGVAHRLEMIRTLRGVTYCNDSIASSPTRTIAGLHALRLKPILIAGGYDKHIPFDGLGTEICRCVKELFLTGFTADKIAAAVTASPEYDPERLKIHIIDDFREAVLSASAAAEEGDLVMLSPACASFDKFKNFEERGNTFRRIVEELE